MRSPAGAVVLVAALLLAGCTGGGAAGPGSSPVPGSALPAPVELPTEVVAAECSPQDGALVTQLPDVVVPEVRVDAVTVGDDVVEGFVVPAVLVDAGCVVEHAAPGGCLGAVEVTAATIPALELPGVDLQGLELAGVDVAAVTAPAVRTEQVCQVEVDGEVPTVSRAGVVREGVSRDGAARRGGARDGARVEAVRVEPVRLPDVDVDPGRLRSRDLDSGVAELTDDGGDREARSFVAPADLLFGTDEDVLRPEAEPALREIAAQLTALDPSAPVRVEGHTDAVGEEAYNLALSQRRADGVAAWLTANGGVDPGRITVSGLGETAPAFPGDSEADRAGNRRVVVTVG